MTKTRKAQELDIVEVTEDLPKYGVKKGEQAVIITAFDEPDEAYDLEFVDESGTSSRFAYSVKPNQIRSADEAARESLEKGIKLHNEGKGAEAEKEFRRAIELKPDLIDELHNLFLRSCEQQDDSEETETFERIIFAMHLVLRLNPEYQIARDNIAIAYEKQGIIEATKGNLLRTTIRFRMALAIATSPEVAFSIRQNLGGAWTQLAIQSYQSGEFQEFLNYMALAYETDSNESTKRNLAVAYADLALRFLNQNNREDATDSLQLAFDIAAITPKKYDFLSGNIELIEAEILEFLKRIEDDLSFDLQTRRIEFHIPQMQQPEYSISP